MNPYDSGPREVTRDVTPDECWWLGETVTAGTVVYRCTRPTYGAVREFPATLDPDGDYPFFELPWDAVEPQEPTREERIAAAEDRAEQAAFDHMREA